MNKLNNKGKHGIAFLVVLALVLRIAGPMVADFAYAVEDEEQQSTEIELMDDEDLEEEAEDNKNELDIKDEVQENPQQEPNSSEEDGEEILNDNEESKEKDKEHELDEESNTSEEPEIEVQADRAPEEITDNIIDNMKLLYKDGTAFKDGDLIGVDEDLRFELDWSLPNSHDYVAGDYFEFKLPEQLTVYNPLDGSLGDHGTYTVDMDGNVKFTFNDNVEDASDVKGTFWFDTELKESKITSTEETIELVINDDVVQKVVVNVKPTAGQAISKEGQPVDGDFNTEEVEWTVIVNTTRESLKNVVIDDPILAGQELILDSLKLTEVEVNIKGEVTQDLDKVTGFTNDSTKENLKIELGDTNKAYKLTFETKLLEDDFKEGTTEYKNDATLKSEGKDDAQAGGSVSVSRPKSIEKTSSEFDKENRSIEWTVNANFTEQSLKKDNVITDEFTFTVGEYEVTDVFEIKAGNISIEQVDKFNSEGNATETSDAKDLFDITIDGNKVTYKLKKDTNKAFILKYKTELKDGAYINKDGKITNEIKLNGKIATGSQDVIQQVGKKSNSGINYEDKTIDWTITVNADRQDLRKLVLTDSFSGSGQKLVADSIKIKPQINSDEIEVNSDNEGFKVNFGSITDTYTIKYQTKFDYDFEGKKTPNFKNGVKITYETSDEDEYELEFGNTVTPNKETKSNGAKNGEVNQKTKEITWKVDINYNELSLADAKLKDVIPDNQSLIEGSVRVYETSIKEDGKISKGYKENEVTEDKVNISEETYETVEKQGDQKKDSIEVEFNEEIENSYRIEFVTKDRDGIYNSDEVYRNTAKFIPRDGEVHNLTANVPLPNQGEFLGKTGTHNKEDWTIDWKVDVNKSLSTTSDFTVTDDLGDPAAQILLEDTIKVTKAGSSDELEEGEGNDYKLTVTGNKFEIYFPGKITEAYEITYSSYILTEEDVDLTNEAKIQSNDVIKGTTEKTEKVKIRISSGGGTSEETGGLKLKKSETGSKRPLENIEFTLLKTVGSKEIVVREGKTDDNGELEWKGLKFGDYTLTEVIPEGYIGKESQNVTISKDSKGVKTLPIENEREIGTAKIIKVDLVTDETLEGAEFTLENQTTGEEYTFTTNGDGVILEEIPFGEYTVEEITAPEGYRITENIDNITVNIDKTTEITVKNVAFVDVAGQKTWYADEDTELPESITVKLLRNGKEYKEKIVTEDNNWKYSFKDLDKYTEANKEINYKIEEVEIDGYISEIKEVEKDQDYKYEYNLTNIQTTNVSGVKAWIDDNDETENRPDAITVQVRNGDKVVKDQKVTADDNWNYTFENLPKYDEEGNRIFYTIDEVGVDGYDKTIDSYNIENLRVGTTTVKGEKTWKDEAATDRPDSIKVNLTREVKDEKDEGFSETQTVKPNNKGNWIYEFEGLDEFDGNGVKYKYIVEEDNVPEKYESEVDGYDITNTRVGTTSVSGMKRWKDDKVSDRPDSITVNLLRNNAVVRTKEVTAKDNWKYTFSGLEEYDNNGKYYNYTVKEQDVLGYSSVVSVHDVTNTRSGEKDIEITKGWLDGDSKDRPDSVIVYIYRNVKLFDTVEVTAENDWAYKAENFEAYDEDGQPYIYIIKEKLIDGYETKVDGFNLTNLRVGETEVTGKKIWKDNNDETGNRPDSITVKLLQNGKEIDSKEVTAEENWEYAFEELEEFDEDGVAYEYTVDEDKIDGYEKSIDGNDLINRRVGKTEVTGTKRWINSPEVKPTIELQLYRNGEAYLDPVILEDGNTQYTWSDLDLTDKDGKEYVYTIDETDLPVNYEKTISEGGLTITNKYVDPEDPSDPEDPEDPSAPEDPEDPAAPEDPEDPTTPGDPTDPSDPQDPTDPDVPSHEDGDLVQTGTDINFLIPIGITVMLIGLAFVFREKFIKE